MTARAEHVLGVFLHSELEGKFFIDTTLGRSTQRILARKHGRLRMRLEKKQFPYELVLFVFGAFSVVLVAVYGGWIADDTAELEAIVKAIFGST